MLIPADWAGQAGRVLREQAGIDLVALTPASRGAPGAAFWITDRAGTSMNWLIRVPAETTGP